MTRRRAPTPEPGRDFRALAADPPQGRLPITLQAEQDDDTADVELQVRESSDGVRYALLTAAVTLRDAATVRKLAERLNDTADAIDGQRKPSRRRESPHDGADVLDGGVS